MTINIRNYYLSSNKAHHTKLAKRLIGANEIFTRFIIFNINHKKKHLGYPEADIPRAELAQIPKKQKLKQKLIKPILSAFHLLRRSAFCKQEDLQTI